MYWFVVCHSVGINASDKACVINWICIFGYCKCNIRCHSLSAVRVTFQYDIQVLIQHNNHVAKL